MEMTTNLADDLDKYENKSSSGKDSKSHQNGPRRSKFKTFLYICFAIVSFFIFFFLKLPEARIHNLLLAHIKILAQQNGYLFNAEKIAPSLLWGPGLKFTNIELKALNNPDAILKLSELRLRPQLHTFIPLFKSKKVSFSLEGLNGSASGSVGMGQTTKEVSLNLDHIDLAQASILTQALPVSLSSAILSGEISGSVDETKWAESSGQVLLKIDKIILKEQSIYGLQLPQIKLNESNIEIQLHGTAAELKKIQLGTDTKKDDVVVNLTGQWKIDTANRYAYSFTDKLTWSNGKLTLFLNPKILQAIPLIDSFIGAAKMKDGKYGYQISGPFSMPQLLPSPN